MKAKTLRVAKESDPKALAGALVSEVETKDKVMLQAIGAGAVNQAVKSVAVAREYVTSRRISLVCTPAFVELEISGSERTGIKLIVEKE